MSPRVEFDGPRARHTARVALLLAAMVACGDDTLAGGGGAGAGGAAAGGGGGAGGAGGGGGLGAGGAGGSIPDCSGDPRGGEDLPDVVHFVEGVTVTTLAGAAGSGLVDGSGPEVRFHDPVNVALLPSGDLAIADFENGAIRRSTRFGDVTTVAVAEVFQRPFGLLVDSNAGLWVGTDFDENGQSAGEAGGALWRLDAETGEPDLRFAPAGRPRGMALFGAGTFAISDQYGETIRRFDPVTDAFSPLAGKEDCPAFADGVAGDARFHEPYGLARLPSGDLVVADLGNHRVRRVSGDGEVTTLAGDGTPDMIDGPAASARFNSPKAVAVDAAGDVFVSDVGNHRIRRITASGTVETVAGDGSEGFANGLGPVARFFGQEGLAVTPDGKTLYVADGNLGEAGPYHRLRVITIP